MRLWAGTVYFVGQHHRVEHRPRVKVEGLGFALVDRHAHNIRRQHVAGELDAGEIKAQHPRQGVGEGCFAKAGVVFDQQVSTSEQAAKTEAHFLWLTQDNIVELGFKAA